MNRRILKAVFAAEADVVAATREARTAGGEIIDVFTPYAVHGLDEAMGLKPSRLTWVCFFCGAAGAGLMLLFQYWTSATDWPINVGGKPFDSLPAFVPITFELAILCGGLGVVAALFFRARLYPGRTARMPDARVVDDRFVLLARSNDPESLRALCERHHAVAVDEEVDE